VFIISCIAEFFSLDMQLCTKKKEYLQQFCKL